MPHEVVDCLGGLKKAECCAFTAQHFPLRAFEQVVHADADVANPASAQLNSLRTHVLTPRLYGFHGTTQRTSPSFVLNSKSSRAGFKLAPGP